MDYTRLWYRRSKHRFGKWVFRDVSPARERKRICRRLHFEPLEIRELLHGGDVLTIDTALIDQQLQESLSPIFDARVAIQGDSQIVLHAFELTSSPADNSAAGAPVQRADDKPDKSAGVNVIQVTAELGGAGSGGELAAVSSAMLPQPATRTYVSSNVPVAIPSIGLVTSTLTVPDSFRITDLNVQLNITHTSDAHLDVFLIAPDGTRVELFTDVGSSGDHFTNTVLDDESPTPIIYSAAPFTGTFRPEGALQSLDGKNAQGLWTLEITDDTSGTGGTLNSWSLAVRGEPTETIPLAPLGVSNGVSRFEVDGQLATFGGEDIYAVDLVAGQRISASVQTPEFGVVRFVNTTPLAIPDNNTAVTSTISVANNITISDLDVYVVIDHLFDADLDIFLIAPNGTRIALSTDNGGSGFYYYETRFDDEAAIRIDDGSAKPPFSGRFRPESPLSVIDGLSTAGDWKLEITDDAAGVAGTLLVWTMEVNAGLDSTLRIVGPAGELASNSNALPSITDAAIVSAVAPTTGTYYLQVTASNVNQGAYTLEGGIYDAAVAGETGDTTNLDPLRAAGNGNAVVLGQGDGIGQSDVYTATLNADEYVVVAASTPGGFYNPHMVVTGPAGFFLESHDTGPTLEAAAAFKVPNSGVYTITIDYTGTQNFRNAISQGSYALSLAVVDNSANNVTGGARPIAASGYFDDPPITHAIYGFTGTEAFWSGEIDSNSDLDYFALGQLAQDQLINLLVTREGGSQLFPGLVLVNSSGQIIDSAGAARSGTIEGSSFLETIIPATDNYYLKVLGDSTEAGGSVPSIGRYVLSYLDFGVVDDVYEDNDSRAMVDAKPAGAPNSANLGVVQPVTALDNLAMFGDSEDWFRFETTASGKLGDYLRIDFEHDNGDLDLYLLNAAGNVIDVSSGTDDGEQINLHGLPAGVYYARIHGYLGAKNPSYNLRIQTQSPNHRLLSAPFTTDANYTLRYELSGLPGSSVQQLVMGENMLMVTVPSGGPQPFKLYFDVTRVGSMEDQTSYQYDLLDNLSRSTDALGRDTVFKIDPLGRMTERNGPAFNDLHQFTYDSSSNLTSIDDATGHTQYIYDALDRLTQIVLPNSLDTIDYGYDLAGRVTSIKYPNGSVVVYAYDAAGRLASVNDGGAITNYTYYADGMLHTTTLPNGITSTYVYNDHARLVDLAHVAAGGALVSSFHYTLDDNGNRTSMEVHRPNASTPDPADYFTSLYAYQYDALDRLTQVIYPDGSVVIYTYDANGNRLSTSTDPDGIDGAPAVVETYHYGYDNRLESITGAGDALVKQFYYAPRGNVVMVVTPTGTTHYEYDFRNMLTAVEDGTNRVEYEYDANGDRVAKIVNGVRTTFINDPNRDNTQVLMELGPTGAVQARYTYGAGRISGVLPGETNPAYYIADALGSTADLTDTFGTVLQSNSYDVFGALRTTDPGGVAGFLANEFLFAGERFEVQTGLQYLRARYSDPSIGRFTSKDRSSFVDGMNLYGYTKNNPVAFVDPSGHSVFSSSFSALFGSNDWDPTPDPGPPYDPYKYRSPLSEGDSRLFDRSGRSPGNSLYSGPARGGVLLDRAVGFVGDLSSITGATVDPVTGQVVLTGTQGQTGVPDLRLDDFVTAVRAIFGSAEDPGVTLDPQPGHAGDVAYPHLVSLFGGLENTDLGWVLLEADRVMKCLSIGRDNVSGATISSSVPGFQSMLQRAADSGASHVSARFWFVPTDVKLVRSDNGQSFVFDRTAVQLLTEDLLVGNGAVDPVSQAFATWVTQNYAALAQESFTVYDYPNETVGSEVPTQMRIFARLEQAAKAIAFARFLFDNNIPIDFSWMENYQIPVRNTPLESRSVQNSTSGGSVTYTISGGVAMNAPNAYLPDVGTAAGTASGTLGSRPDDLAQSWTVPGGQTAVALSLDSAYNDGTERRSDTDLSYQTAGDMPLGLTRIYDSTSPTAGIFGFGWTFLPYQVEFSRPEFFSSDRSPYTFLNGLRTGEIRITNEATGRVLTFESSFFTVRLADGTFAYGGLNAQGVPDFTPGGSEQPDGSTLVQNPTTLAYTLTMPDGSRVVFDGDGRLQQLVDNRNRAVSYGYTGNRVTSISDAAGQTITLNYDPQGRISQAAGLGGEVVNYDYDAAGNLIHADRVRQGEHIKYSYTYDADHRLTSVMMPDQVIDTTNVSDLLGRTTVRGDARGNDFHSDFDLGSRTTVTTDMADGTTVTRQTDSLNRPTQVTDQLGRTTTYIYAGQNRQPTLVISPDPLRPTILRLYDENGNVIFEDDPARGGDPIQSDYDANNNLLELQDARGIVTKFTYNSFNQRTSMTRAFGTPLAATWTWTYDPATGFLASQNDPSGVVTAYEYDARGNLIRETVAPGTAAETNTFYGYDAFSRRISMTDGEGRVTTYAYDGRDQVTATTLTGPPPISSASSYDPLSGRKLTEIDFNSHSATYSYDTTTGDLVEENDNGSITRYSYDRFGNITRIVDPVGNVTTFEYDVMQRLTRVRSLGSTPRVTEMMGSASEVVIAFSDPMDVGLVDNGVDVFVQNAASQTVPGTVSFSADGRTMTWTPTGGNLAPGNYSITLRAQVAGQFTTSAGVLLDGDFFGLLPSGENTPGGNFVGSWLVDDHGNDAAHADPMLLPVTVGGNLEFAGDADWFRFDAVAGNRFAFEVVLDSLFDSVLRLYGPDGETVLELNDDIDVHNGQYGSRIEWQVPQTGQYYVSVRGAFELFTGTYQLQTTLLQDDHADNSSMASAVTVPSVTDGNLEVTADLDMFSFQAVAGQKYRIATILGTLDDSILRLYDTNGTTVLASNDDFGGTLASRVFWTAPGSGIYFVGVSSLNAASAGSYQLALSTDDHRDRAADATTVLANSTTAGNVEVLGDEDWFAFPTVAGTDYRLRATAGSLVNPEMTFYETDGITAVPAASYTRIGQNVYWTAPSSGTFYLRVRGGDGTGMYSLDVTSLVDDHADVAPGTNVAIPSVTPASLEMPGDTDVFAFNLLAGTKYRLEVALGDLPDSLLTLLDTDGTTVIGTNDDYQGLGSRIDFFAPAAGTYFARVASSSGGLLPGSYTLSVQQLEIIPPVGDLVAPGPGIIVTVDNGYVDISWADAGGSGIDAATIDSTDVTISGVTVTGVQNRGSGVWRYLYAGSLPEGPVQVKMQATHVSDTADNWNAETIRTFVFDTSAPSVSSLSIVPNPRSTPIQAVTINFSEPVTGFTLSDLILTRSGSGGNLLSGTQVLSSTDGKTWVVENLASVTAALGNYELKLVAAGSGIVDAAGRNLSNDLTATWTVGLAGDYNGDGSVDAADYVVWRKTGINGQEGYNTWRANFGATLPSVGLAGDYNGDGSVDAADYVVWRKTGINGQEGYSTWRANFGATLPSPAAGSGSSSAIAEPEIQEAGATPVNSQDQADGTAVSITALFIKGTTTALDSSQDQGPTPATVAEVATVKNGAISSESVSISNSTHDKADTAVPTGRLSFDYYDAVLNLPASSRRLMRAEAASVVGFHPTDVPFRGKNDLLIELSQQSQILQSAIDEAVPLLYMHPADGDACHDVESFVSNDVDEMAEALAVALAGLE